MLFQLLHGRTPFKRAAGVGSTAEACDDGLGRLLARGRGRLAGLLDAPTLGRVLRAAPPIGCVCRGRSARALARRCAGCAAPGGARRGLRTPLALSAGVAALLRALLAKEPSARCTVATAKAHAWCLTPP